MHVRAGSVFPERVQIVKETLLYNNTIRRLYTVIIQYNVTLRFCIEQTISLIRNVIVNSIKDDVFVNNKNYLLISELETFREVFMIRRKATLVNDFYGCRNTRGYYFADFFTAFFLFARE